MLKVKLHDGTEMIVTNFNANVNVNNNTGNINFQTSFDNHDLVYEKVNPENMIKITLITEKSDIVYSDFKNNITIVETISELNKSISISASKIANK